MADNSFLLDELAALRQAGMLRSLRRLQGASGPVMQVGEQQAILLCSNNYLGLADDPRMKQAACEAVLGQGTAATGSRLISGNSDLYDALEEDLARFKGCEAALVFASGYHSNLGCISALAGPGDTVFSDALNHASIIDGCRLSRATVAVYRHVDAGHLEELLRSQPAAGRRLIITESVFSMDGDVAPLADISALARRYGALVMVDEAHGTGVAGPNGAGVVESLGLAGHIDIQMGTFSKALASLGGYVAGSRALIAFLLNKARSFIFTTGLPPAVLGASREALKLVQQEPERRARLMRHSEALIQGLRSAGFTIGPTGSQIIPVLFGEEQTTMSACQFLLEQGVFVQGIRPPTVPAGTSRLRLTPMATHSDKQVMQVLEAFSRLADFIRRPGSGISTES